MPQEKILIVDDEPEIVEVCMRMLEAEGYEVEGAWSGREAIEKAKEKEFDLLLADIVMPDMSGLETFQKIREFNPDITGVVITAYGALDHALSAIDLGIKGFIIKPFTIEKLEKTVAEALEKVRLERENVRLKALLPLFELNRTFMRTVDLNELLKRIVQVAEGETKADRTSLALLDEETQKLAIKTSVGLPPETVSKALREFEIEISERVAREGGLLMLQAGEEVEPRLSEAIEEAGISAVICSPLVSKGNVIGALNLIKLDGSPPFTQGDVEFISILCGQAAIAIDNAKLYEEMNLLKEISRRIALTVNLEDILDFVVEIPKRLVGAKASLILYFDEETKELSIINAHGLSDEQLEGPILGEGISARVCNEGEPLFAVDVEEIELGIASLLSLPLKQDEGVIGAFNVYLPSKKLPGKRKIEILSTIANELATAMESARLRARDLLALYEVDRTLRAEPNLEKLLRHILRKTIEACEADSGAISLYNEETKLLTTLVAQGLPEALGNARFRVGEGLAGWVAQMKRPIVVNDVRSNPRWKPLIAEEYEFGSVICVPMVLRGELVGVIHLWRRLPKPFSGRDLNFLSTIASQAALAVRNAQLYIRSEELAITEERNRIAREIHDGIAQSLASLLLEVDLNLELLESEPEMVRKGLMKIREVIEENISEIRRSIFALRPIDLDRLGFLTALRKYIGDFSEQNRIPVHLEVLGEEAKLSSRLEYTLFRIVQESLNNVRKHADAESVWIELDMSRPESVSLTIRDDGRGFDLEEALANAPSLGNLGLIQMKERVEEIRGEFAIETKPGYGTKVIAVLPAL
jgi:signal transduction histidine kinase/DNA-binding response OmpR family regulator